MHIKGRKFFLVMVALGVCFGVILGIIKKPSDVSLNLSNTKELKKASCSHLSYSNNPIFFNKAFNTVKETVKSPRPIKALVVNHHLLADSLIAEAFLSVPDNNIETIVLLASDHFNNAKGQATTSLCDWQTPFGVLPPDLDLIDDLGYFVKANESPFEYEHSVFNLVAYIQKAFPKAKFVPIIFPDFLSKEKSQEIASKLAEVMPEKSLVIATTDFTHELPSLVADFHDTKSLAVLSAVSIDDLDFIDVDSKPALRTLLGYIDKINSRKFKLLSQTNADKIISNKQIKEVTSYITGYYTEGEIDYNPNSTLLFLGDMMLDRYIRLAIEKNFLSYPFKDVTRFLGGSDLVVTNLEGSFTDFEPKPISPNNLYFTFNPELAPILADYGLNTFNLANNHSLNFGEKGLNQSKKYLNENQLTYFGDPNNNNDLSVIKDIRGQKVGLVGYHQLTKVNFSRVIGEIKQLRSKVDWLVVYAHWGNEYQLFQASVQQRQDAYKLIDAGADVIIGSHPHVIQPIEIYKNKAIFYSLGNFIFDQTFSPDTEQGLGVGMVVGEKKVKYFLFPMGITLFKAKLLNPDKSAIILKRLSESSRVDGDIKRQILSGYFLIEK